MAKWYLKLDANQKALFILGMIGFLGFVLLLPFFFFHLENNYPLGALPLGWLLGSLAEVLSAFLLFHFTGSILDPKNDSTKTIIQSIGAYALRFALYVIVLLFSAICTFVPAWFGGFNAFNFFSCAAALLPMLFVILFTQYQSAKTEDLPVSKKPAEEDKKS